MYSLGDSTQKEYKKKNNKEHFLMGTVGRIFPFSLFVPYKWRFSWFDWIISLIIIAMVAMSMGGGGRR